MLDLANQILAVPQEGPPRLVAVIDTEEEFDWAKPVSRSQIGVSHIRDLRRAHEIFDRFKLRPTYVVDYAVASQRDGYQPLRELLSEGLCDIGAHLHPWVNPPFDGSEELPGNSFPGNLPKELEGNKLRLLTELIEERFGARPRIYRAGRYGVGPATAGILENLGYEIDTSVVPASDFRSEGGPDFRHCPPFPYWFGRHRKLLEIPLTVAWVGLAASLGFLVHGALNSSVSRRLRLAGLLSRTGILERIRLTPEGITLPELKRLTVALLRRGHKIFSLTFHSPSLTPGHTPYVRSSGELENFLGLVESYLEFFVGTVGGEVSTLAEIRKSVIPARLDGSV